MPRGFYAAVLALCLVLPGRAADPSAPADPLAPALFSGAPLVRVFTDRETGMNGAVTFAQAPDGLLYAASFKGLFEFDGVTWRVVPGAADRGMLDVAVDARGRIFYGAHREFGMLAPGPDGVLAARPLHPRLPAADQDVDVVPQVLVHGDDVYFLLTGRNAIVRVDAQGEPHLIRTPEAPHRLHAWGGVVFVQTFHHVYQLQHDTLQPYQGGSLALKPHGVRAILSIWPDGRGGAWQIGADGLRRWQGDDAPLISPAVGARLGTDSVLCGVPLPDGTFALGTAQQGVLRVRADGSILAEYNETRGLGSNSDAVRNLLVDRQGGLWLAQANCVIRIQVINTGALHGGARGLRGTVRSMALHAGRLQVGTTQGLYERDPRFGDFAPRFTVAGSVVALASTPAGLLVGASNLLLLGNEGSAVILDPRAPISLVPLPGDPDQVVASFVDGLRFYRRDAGGWQPGRKVAAAGGWLVNLKIDAAGWLWAARSNRELVRIDFRQGPREDARVEVLGAAHGLPNYRAERQNITPLLLEGSLLLASPGALLRYDAAADRFVPEIRVAGLTQADASRWVFPLGDEGFFMAQPEANRRFGIGRRTGPGAWSFEWHPYTGLESIAPAFVLEEPRAATLWLGGSMLASVSLSAPRLVVPPPAASVRRVTTLDQKILWGGSGTPASATLSPEDNSLIFRFAAPSFQADAEGLTEVEYRTQLAGFDRQWSRWSPDTLRTYTNLPPGEFTFRVQARSADDREGPEAAYAFRLLPPWWRTWWFLGLAGVCAVGSIASLSRWLAQRAFQRRLALVEARSGVERERLRLARDLHDEVGSGLGRIILFTGEALRSQGNPPALVSALDRAQDSAQELMQHAREIVWAVSPQHDTLASVIERLGDYADETLRAAGIACRVESPPPEKIPSAPLGSESRHSLFLALKEAVHNCVKYSEAKTAELTFAIVDGAFVVTLRDHGRGFASGECRGTGHGTKNIAARALALGGSAEIASAPGQGATVTLRLPLPATPEKNSP